ncbi:MAG TPA: hypothetical protein VHF46_07815, partial [Rubrobacteraceae bacterium]|nr:hypothetical protein [Rubrobacteraceae bacterium]
GCKIWIGDRFFTGGIHFSFNESGPDSSYNDILFVEDDGYSQFLKPQGLAMHGRRADKQQLTNEGGAEYFWDLFIEPLQT